MVKKEDFMQDLQDLQLIAQLIDNIEIVVNKLEKAYSDKNGEGFKKAKEEILNSQKKVKEMLE